MSYQVLARKLRPKNFDEMVGQEHVLRALINGLNDDRLHHAYLFTGTRGVGKTTIARAFAKCLNCEEGITAKPCGVCSACIDIERGRFIDLIEVDAASRTKVDETRELLENVMYTPSSGRFKIYLIDEVHMFSKHSFNALLKTLEEPPAHVKFLLATTDPKKLPVTILSRCLQFNLKRIPAAVISDYLVNVLNQEGLSFEAPALRQIARAADGSMRDALSLLDQAIALGQGNVVQSDVELMLGSVSKIRLFELLQAVMSNDASGLLQALEKLIEFAPDYENVLAEFISLLHKIARYQLLPGSIDDDDEQKEVLRFAEELSPQDVQLFYQIGLHGRRDLPLSPDPREGLEMTLLRMMAFRPAAASIKESEPRLPASSRSVSLQSVAVKEKLATPPEPVAKQTDSRPVEPKHEPAQSRSAATENTKPGDWKEIVGNLGLAGLPLELALNCEMQSKQGGELILSLSANQSQLNKANFIQRLEQACCQFFGEKIRIKIETSNGASETPANIQKRHVEARQLDAENAILADPFIQEVCDKFDAKVVKNSIQPVDNDSVE